MMSDRAWALQWLQTGQPLTPRDAYRARGCLRLAPRIKELRAEGWPITTTMREQTVNGRRERYAEYRLEERDAGDVQVQMPVRLSL